MSIYSRMFWGGGGGGGMRESAPEYEEFYNNRFGMIREEEEEAEQNLTPTDARRIMVGFAPPVRERESVVEREGDDDEDYRMIMPMMTGTENGSEEEEEADERRDRMDDDGSRERNVVSPNSFHSRLGHDHGQEDDMMMMRHDEDEEEEERRDSGGREDVGDDEDCRDSDFAMERFSYYHSMPFFNRSPAAPQQQQNQTKRLRGLMGTFFGQVEIRDDNEPTEEDDNKEQEEGPRNKRRRIVSTAMVLDNVVSNSVREGFFEAVPTLEERTQNLMEYSLPITLPCMFKGLHFSMFAQYWCYLIVVGHTIETLVSDFGPRTINLRVPFAWIPPLYHHLCDCFWLHPFITSMFVLPHKFGDNHTKVFWMALALVQTLPIYLSVSFKTHYLKNQHKVHSKSTKGIKRRLIDVALFYYAATLFLLLSHLVSSRWCFWIGLTLWNIAPIYLTFSYKKRFDDAVKKMKQHEQKQK